MSEDDDESNPFKAPHLDAPQAPSDDPGALVRSISFCMTTSFFFLGALLPCGFLVSIRILPAVVFSVVILLFFGSLILAILLAALMAVLVALKAVFFRRDTSQDS